MTPEIKNHFREHPTHPQRVFVADLGGTHLRSAVVDANGTIHFRAKQKTPDGKTAEKIVDAILEAARACDHQITAPTGQTVDDISVGATDRIHVTIGSFIKVPNLPFLNGFKLAAALTQGMQRPAIIENDANAAAVGEMWQGAARGCRSIVCLTLGTGVGGGIIIEEKLWHGAHHAAAEIGHMCVEPFGGVACGCGSEGCLEVYASATAIVRMTREAQIQYPNTLVKIEDDLTSESVYRAGLAGDALALEVFRRMGSYLGIGLANLINVLNPEMIVIGGGAANAWELFKSAMHEEVAKRAFPLLADLVKIMPAQCGDDAGLFGAAKLAFSH
jgi:glucokinase